MLDPTRPLIRWCAVFACLAITALFALFLPRLTMDNSNKSFFKQGDPSRELLEQFQATFGNEEFVYLLYDGDRPITLDIYGQLAKLADVVMEKAPYIKRVTWLGNVEIIKLLPDGILIEPLFKNPPQTQAELDRGLQKALGNPALVGNILSRDLGAAALLLEFEPFPDSDKEARKSIWPALKEILKNYGGLGIKAVGGPVISSEFDRIGAEESGLFGLLSLAVVAVLLVLLSRTLVGMVFPLVVMVLSLIWTLGTVAMFGWPLTMVVVLLPTLLICVSVGDTLHLLSDYQTRPRDLDKANAFMSTFKRVALPILFTSITTMAGFLSFAAAPIRPLAQMGVYAAAGVFYAMLISLTLAPSLLLIGKRKVRDPQIKPNPALAGLANLALGRPFWIIGVFCALTITVGLFIAKVGPNTSTIESLSADVPLRQAYDAVDRRMGGTMSLEVVLKAPGPAGVRNLQSLKALESLQSFLDKNPYAMKTSSVLDIIKQLRQALHDDDPAYYALPETDKGVSEYLFLYETGGGSRLDALVSFDYFTARLTLRTKSLDTEAIRSIMAQTKQWAAQNLPEGYEVYLVGSIALMAAMADHVSTSVAMSLSLAFISITIMMMLLLRSVRLGLLSMIPNVLPAMFAFGLMGLLDIDLHLSLAVLAPVILGVSVDDTVHFFHRLNHHLNEGLNLQDSLRQTITHTGRALLFTSLVLVLGFSVLSLSSSNDYVDFAIVAAAAFLYALLADLLLVPAMLLKLPGLLPKRSGRSRQAAA